MLYFYGLLAQQPKAQYSFTPDRSLSVKLTHISTLVITAFALAACGSSGSSNAIKTDGQTNNGSAMSELDKAVLEAKKLIRMDNPPDDPWKHEIDMAYINGKSYDLTKPVDLTKINDGKLGYIITDYTVRYKGGEPGFVDIDGQYTGKFLIYNLPYSIMLGQTITGFEGKYKHGNIFVPPADVIPAEDRAFSVEHIAGLGTKAEAIDKLAGDNISATYQGLAFKDGGQGKIITAGNLDYTIDFGARSGQGKIGSSIILEKGNITAFDQYNAQQGIYGKVTGLDPNTGYALGIYGPNAEGIMGAIHKNNGEDIIGFGGERQK